MLSKTPPMGFNTWNTFGHDINETVIKETADALVSTGLRDAGYEYLVIDDCWSEKQRDPETGKIIPDHIKFPNGMKCVSDYVHSKGLKFGMYSCAGTRTCADYPSSFGHEFLDAETFAEYGADFLKYDYCFRPAHYDGDLMYRRMGLALKACGREILFSACNWGADDVHKWIRSTGAHMYRSTGDINDSFVSMRDIALSQVPELPFSASGCFNDIDMLTIGMYGKGNVAAGGCNDTEYKTQFALWCMFAAPLMLGGDIRTFSEDTLRLVTNKKLIRINQDEECRPAFDVSMKIEKNADGQNKFGVSDNGKRKVYFRLLSDNEFAVLFVNFGDSDARIDFYMSDVGLAADTGYGLDMTEVFTDEHLGVKKEFMSRVIKAHDCECYLCKLAK